MDHQTHHLDHEPQHPAHEPQHPAHEPQHPAREPHLPTDGHGQHRGLDLDAEVFGDQLVAALDLAGVCDARMVVDLGAGTGAGSRMLRARFPDASVTCVDNDPQMLERLREQGFAVVEADLDLGFPALAGSSTTADGPVDLAWASSSLHHVTHPGLLLSGVRRALKPHGVLVVVELATLPAFSSTTDPAEVSLEQRCHAAAAAEGWNHFPDWTPVIEAAGFRVATSELSTVAPATATAREYAKEWFGRFLHLASLGADDRDAVTNLLDQISDGRELEPRATRTVWVATPDHSEEQS